MKAALVVDDDPSVLRAMSRVIAQAGVRVVTASGAAQALCRLQVDPQIGLVISDVQMPGMNGFELLGSVMGNPQWIQVRVVLMTGTVGLKSPPEVILLQKPLTDAQVHCVVATHLGGKCPYDRTGVIDSDEVELRRLGLHPLGEVGVHPTFCAIACRSCPQRYWG